ncbi:MAG TPA: SRPBCC family protein [Caulobacteraceae bacterium]|jgi:carbon monoxide dehydrogenase subunit G|nr:SRPBCC family protein [Caulobacteraceae bacterium]
MTATDTFRVERSIHVDAAPSEIAPLILDFHRWMDWSPWDKTYPETQRAYSGAASGVGAVYDWSGKKAGAGRMEIRGVAPERITIQLDFARPFKASNTAEFSLAPEGGGTRVTWAMFGPKTMISKVMGLFFSMDAMVGKDFEKGLADLKAQAERAPVTA